MQSEGIGYMIKTIHDRMKAIGDNDLRAHELTYSQAQVLRFLRRHGSKASQKEIEVFLDVSHPTVVGLVNRLADKEFVECTTDENDRRNKIVTLTPKAESLSRVMHNNRVRTEKAMLDGFSNEEAKLLAELLLRVYQNLETEREGNRQ